MAFDVVETTLASAVADAGTFAVTYPTGADAGTYSGGYDHMVAGNGIGVLKQTNGDISVSFGATTATITNSTGSTLPAGTALWVQLDRLGDKGGATSAVANSDTMSKLYPVEINLRAPDTIDVNGVFEAVSQAAGAITLDGALASGGVVTFDVPRNIVIDSGGADTSKITFTGTDEYGTVIVEDITLNGTTAVSGKKAFKTITAAANAATTSNGAFAGPGDVLGLPVFLPSAGHVLEELEDGAIATAGTVVAGVTAVATATTGDTRGTYDANSAADGSKVFRLVVMVPDPGDKGVTQYGG